MRDEAERFDLSKPGHGQEAGLRDNEPKRFELVSARIETQVRKHSTLTSSNIVKDLSILSTAGKVPIGPPWYGCLSSEIL